MRKWMGMALTMCLLLTGCGGEKTERLPVEEPSAKEMEPQTKAPAASAADDWRTAYKQFLTDLCRKEAAVRNIDRPDYDPNVYPGEIGNQSDEYVLYDVDKDGTPELFVRYGKCEAAYRTKVYTYREGTVAELGEFISGHGSLYTWPGENGVAYNWSHMGGHVVEKISLVDGALVQENVFEEKWTDPDMDYTDMADIVPGSLYLRGARTTLELIFLEEAGSDADTPLTLPIDDYGRERTRRKLDPARNEAAREAITAVLKDSAELCGVSADGFGGESGTMTLKQYLAPGGVDRYAEVPQKVDKLAWLDVNGDGQTECVLSLLDADNWPDQMVILSEQKGMVYAYCLSYQGGYSLDREGVFWHEKYGRDSVSFNGEQCYTYTVVHEKGASEVIWEAP
ncbi:hypothetical protein [Oscillibacter sp.]|uniref:hypothetical protein n=1 Tax=Oscillibacter sp. TaxID=1945593 RepID=UPI001B48FD3B|nr:hypothetical protein [Oscillibacter sp.]MBP3510237.1 hypothetical protein [Oscillibacter sp.]